MYNPDKVYELVAAGAAALRNECIERHGTIHFHGVVGERYAIAPPPLLTDARLRDVDLTTLGPAFHYVPLGEDEVLRVFRDVARWCNGHKASGHIIRYFLEAKSLDVRLTPPPGASSIAMIVQYLYLASWSIGKVHITNRLAELEIGAGTLHVGRQHVSGPDIYRRLARPLNFSPLVAARHPLGLKRRLPTKATALFRELLRVLPDLAQFIHLVFHGAAHGPRQAMDVLCKAFDVEVESAQAEPKGEIVSALALLEKSVGTDFPTVEAYKVLTDAIGKDQAEEVLGPRRRWYGSRKYSQAAFDRHRIALLGVQAENIHGEPLPTNDGTTNIFNMINTIR